MVGTEEKLTRSLDDIISSQSKHNKSATSKQQFSKPGGVSAGGKNAVAVRGRLTSARGRSAPGFKARRATARILAVAGDESSNRLGGGGARGRGRGGILSRVRPASATGRGMQVHTRLMSVSSSPVPRLTTPPSACHRRADSLLRQDAFWKPSREAPTPVRWGIFHFLPSRRSPNIQPLTAWEL